MDKRKYLVAFIGLTVGFIVSFIFTSKYNRDNMVASAGAQQQAAMPDGHGGQAGMADVQQTLAKARNNPKDFAAQVDAASAFAQIGNDDGALEFLEKAYAADSTKFARLTGAATYLGDVYLKMKKYDDAAKWFKRAIEIDAKDTEALVHLVESHAMKKDAGGAEEALGRLKQADPKNAKIMALETMVADVKAGKPVSLLPH